MLQRHLWMAPNEMLELHNEHANEQEYAEMLRNKMLMLMLMMMF